MIGSKSCIRGATWEAYFTAVRIDYVSVVSVTIEDASNVADVMAGSLWRMGGRYVETKSARPLMMSCPASVTSIVC